MPDSGAVNKRIGSRLRMAREKAGLTQAQVAKLLGLHRPSVTETEAGNRRVTAEELSSLAKIYSVDVSWLSCVDATKDADKDRIELAARELAKLKDEDFQKVVDLLAALRKSGGAR